MALSVGIFAQLDPICGADRIFLNNDGAGACGHGGTGKNAHCCIGCQITFKSASCCGFSDHAITIAAFRCWLRDRVAIHGRGIKWRLIAQGCHRARQNAAHGFGEIYPFHTRFLDQREKSI